MSLTIAFLSGKGGSGKTTLALSTADLLCQCGVRTLLTDCDLSTNGATYFYESLLLNRASTEEYAPHSFSSLFSYAELQKDPEPLRIKQNLDFFPSVPGISGEYFTERNLTPEVGRLKNIFRDYIFWARKNYDVILFDCQAGYSGFMPELLPMMDVNLFVLEPDSISASAMRSLHLKIGAYLGRKPYQVFNKANEDEYETYSKIDSTFFTNIGTFRFDWKIRQAFSRSQIPDLENTSAGYGEELCNVCKTMMKGELSVLNKLNCFSDKLKKKKLEEELKETMKKREQSESTLNQLAFLRKSSARHYLVDLIWFLSFGGLFAILTIYAIFLGKLQIPEVLLSFALIIMIILYLIRTKPKKSYTVEIETERQSYESYGRSLDELELKIKKLSEKEELESSAISMKKAVQ